MLKLMGKVVIRVLTVGILLQPVVSWGQPDSIYYKLIQPQAQVDDNGFAQPDGTDGNQNSLSGNLTELEAEKAKILSSLEGLQKQINDLRTQLLAIDQQIKTLTEPKKIVLSISEIDGLMKAINNSGCQISPGEKALEYRLTNSRNETIRFFFSDTNSPFASYAQLKQQNQTEIVEVIQPSFRNSDLDKASDMEARITYKMNQQKFEIVEMTFLGQKIEDRSFGRSSFDPFRLVCKTSLNP